MKTFTSELEIIQHVLTILESSPLIAKRYMGMISVLKDRQQRALHHVYRMGVIGVTSSGKSTLINSFLHEDLLPSGVQPSSSQLVSCQRGNLRSATVLFNDRNPQTFKDSQLTPQLISKYADERNNPKNVKHVKQIEILSSAFPFDRDIVLVDSPGLDAYKLEGHEKLTLNTLLPSVDFCLFITTCKTNSDKKTLEVLNEIADYEKDVIVVQNMIDSIQPSLNVDGSIRKDKSEVAKEYITRVRKIVEQSRLKTAVPIIQYSAVWARKAQKVHDETLLSKSGYVNLIGQINKMFLELLPKAEFNRISFVKQDIEKLIHNADIDGTGVKVPIAPFEFEGVTQQILSDLQAATTSINELLENLCVVADNVLNLPSVSELDIAQAKQACSECTAKIASIQKGVYGRIKIISEKIRVPVIQLFDEQTKFPGFTIPSLRYDTVSRVEWKDKGGFLNSLKRGFGNLFGNDSWGREQHVTHEKVLNVDESKLNIVRYLKGAQEVYTKTLMNWHKKIKDAIRLLDVEIQKYHKEYEDRVNSALAACVSLEVADKLRHVLERIPQFQANSATSETEQHAEANRLHAAEIPNFSYNVFKLANMVNNQIHENLFHRLLPVRGNEENIILGWDLPCLKLFLQQSFGRTMNDCNESFKLGDRVFHIYYNATTLERVKRHSFSSVNVFVLISALQHGQALTHLNKIKLQHFLHKADHLFLVVQDFQEIVNADVVNDGLGNLTDIQDRLSLPVKPTIILMHENVVYNLAAIETQMLKGKNSLLVHVDEISILSDLRSSIFKSQCMSPRVSNIIMKIIKSLK